MNKKILTIIQARSGSTRLPNKIFLEVLGKSLLEIMIERVNVSKLKGQIVIATTNKKEDNAVMKLCKSLDIDCFRGSEFDLLDRHYQCAKKFNADIVLKIPSDCPLIDPKVIDKVIKVHLATNSDYTSNLHPQSYPDGQDVEVMNFKALKIAW